MPSYRLEYFDSRGRGEPIRWVLAVAEQYYEDDRFPNTEWPTKKLEVPYGHVPILHVGNKSLSQSVDICRYLGKMHNLYVDDPWESAKGDEIADSIADLVLPAFRILEARIAGDKEKNVMLVNEFFSTTFPPYLKEFEKRLEGREWFCGSKMTWVDVYAACFLDQYGNEKKGTFDTAPKLKALIERVLKLPQIEKWLKERPQTLF